MDHDLGYITTFPKYIREAFGFMISSDLINSAEKTYPKVYDGLESYWQEMNFNWLLHSMDLKESISRKKIDCKHNWHKVNIFKLEGNYYHCRKCNNVISQPQMDKIHGSK